MLYNNNFNGIHKLVFCEHGGMKLLQFFNIVFITYDVINISNNPNEVFLRKLCSFVISGFALRNLSHSKKKLL